MSLSASGSVDTWESLQRDFSNCENEWSVVVPLLNGRVSVVQYLKAGIAGRPQRLSAAAADAGAMLLIQPPQDMSEETRTTMFDTDRWWRYLAYDVCATTPGPCDKHRESSDKSHEWITRTISGAEFESAMACKSLVKLAPPQEERLPLRRTRRRKPTAKVRPLTDRQAESLRLYGEQKGNMSEVARLMGVKRATAQQHYDEANAKLAALGSVPRKKKAKTESLRADHLEDGRR